MEPDFDSEMLERVARVLNLDGNFLNKHAKYIEAMLQSLEDPYGKDDLKPEQVHALRIRILHTFIRKAYDYGRQDGLTTAGKRIASKITGGYSMWR
ncbi:MAG: hypothetical protein JRE23_03215 [Deltaproteobacteria bacterium]|nr:hypothetical protein [Deltaproteobacteria bacterium]